MATTTFSLKELEDDPRLFLYTSLTAGSSHIITATSRMETILKANRIPFQAIDIATDEKARRLWQRRAGQRKLPGLVKEGYVIGDLNQIEEWNEFGELKENIGPVPANNAAPPGGQVGVNIAPPSLLGRPAPTASTTTIRQAAPVNKAPQPVFDKSKAIRLPGAEEMAAIHKEKAAAAAASASTPKSTLTAIKPETLTSSPEDQKESVENAKETATSEKEETAPAPSVPETESSAAKEPETVTEKEAAKAEETASTATTETRTEAALVEEKKKGSEEAPIEEKETTENEKLEATQVEPSKPEPEEPETEAATKGVADLKVDEEKKKTQDQDPKESEDAAKSVED